MCAVREEWGCGVATLPWPWSPTRNQAAKGGLGPQQGTELRHNGEGPPSLFLARAFSPFGFGSVADRAPSRRFLALTARDGLSRLSGAVFIAHHRTFRLRAARC